MVGFSGVAPKVEQQGHCTVRPEEGEDEGVPAAVSPAAAPRPTDFGTRAAAGSGAHAQVYSA